MEREFSVLYFSAPQLFSVLTQTKFDRNDVDSKNMNDYIFNCDLLIIDDLGSEYTNAFIAAQFFTCINERLIHKKSTIISTNLSLESLANLYTERSFSRITSSYALLKIIGDDIRIKKKFISLFTDFGIECYHIKCMITTVSNHQLCFDTFIFILSPDLL